MTLFQDIKNNNSKGGIFERVPDQNFPVTSRPSASFGHLLRACHTNKIKCTQIQIQIQTTSNNGFQKSQNRFFSLQHQSRQQLLDGFLLRPCHTRQACSSHCNLDSRIGGRQCYLCLGREHKIDHHNTLGSGQDLALFSIG